MDEKPFKTSSKKKDQGKSEETIADEAEDCNYNSADDEIWENIEPL